MSYHTEEEIQAIRDASAVELIAADIYFGSRRNLAIFTCLATGVTGIFFPPLLIIPFFVVFWALKYHFWVRQIRKEAMKRIAENQRLTGSRASTDS